MSAKANNFFRQIILTILTYLTSPISRYDVLVDIAPEIKWIPDNNAYKNLKIVVEIDSDIDAHTASEQEFRRRYKSIGALKVVTDRGLQVTKFNLYQSAGIQPFAFFFFKYDYLLEIRFI